MSWRRETEKANKPDPRGGLQPRVIRSVVCKKMNATRINSVDPYDWTDILAASQSEGYNMVNRLLTDFRSGTNRFDAPGELLLAQLSGNRVVAVAGLNQEPDDSIPRAGRIRRLYVVPEFRGKGLARALIEQIVSSAGAHFENITVNVGKLGAWGFYEHLGFTPLDRPAVTHVKKLAHNKELHSYAVNRERER